MPEKRVLGTSDLQSPLQEGPRTVHGIGPLLIPLITPLVKCYVYMASDKSSPTANGDTTIPLDTVVSDPSSLFNTGTYVATIKKAGEYLLTAGIQVSNAVGGNRGIKIAPLINGAAVQLIGQNDTQATGTVLVYCGSLLMTRAVGDTVGLNFNLTGATGANMKIKGGANLTWMRLALLHL
jgi:hypothetical protein